MKRFLFLAVLLATACSGESTMASRAEHFVRSTYNDVDRILSVKVDTVTYGDNLDYRIERAQSNTEFAAHMFRTYKGEKDAEGLKDALAWEATLDSLKQAAGDILEEPAAYSCIVTYNRPGNLVWVQLDKSGNLLNVTKDVDKILINPGDDVPGYLDAYRKHHNL